MKKEKQIMDEKIINEKIAKGEKLTFAERNALNIKIKRSKSTAKTLEYGRKVNNKKK